MSFYMSGRSKVRVIRDITNIIGLKRLDDGSLVKDYEGPEKEIAQALQLAVSQVTYEDERYIVGLWRFPLILLGARCTTHGAGVSGGRAGHIFGSDGIRYCGPGRVDHIQDPGYQSSCRSS